MSNVLDLSLEKQEAMAERRGMAHADWVVMIKETLKEGEAFRQELDANKGVRPEGWTDEDTKRFQKKIDSGNPRPA
jgi:hypothetical protein